MNKILLIARREFLTRVRKKSFIVMTILGPLLLIGFYSMIIYLSINKDFSNEMKTIVVADHTGLFKDKLQENKYYKFQYADITDEAAKKLMDQNGVFAFLKIPAQSNDTQLTGVQLNGLSQPSINDQSYVAAQLRRVVQNRQYAEKGIDRDLIQKIDDIEVKVEAGKITAQGLKSGNTLVSTMVGMVSAVLIYFFIFIYGVQIMRGVMEEKMNRIVEVVISSVKPFELMMGKITGIAMVALVQFSTWVLLSVVLGSFVMSSLGLDPATVQQAAGQVPQQAAIPSEMQDIQAYMATFPWVTFGLMFIFYFISGYLFYGSLFAAVGSAVDNETETQQFMLPITLPLLFAVMMAQSVISNPNGTMAFWLSIVPFTSPIVMMVRLPFEVPAWEIALSMALMAGGFVFTTWLAGRIYRTGILLYGKKISYRELGRWLFYKG